MTYTTVEESKETGPELIPEPLKETQFNNVDVNNADDILEKNLLLAITPDEKCIGIKVKYGMPESFDNAQSREEWLKESVKRSLELKSRIEMGTTTIESVKDMIDMKPSISEAMIAKLIAERRIGLCIKFPFIVLFEVIKCHNFIDIKIIFRTYTKDDPYKTCS